MIAPEKAGRLGVLFWALALLVGAPANAATDGLYSDDPVFTLMPARDMAGNATFAGRRQAIARPDDPAMSEFDRGRVALLGFTRCIWDFRPADGRKLLAATPGPQLAKVAAEVADGRCLLRGFITYRPSSLQLAMFATAYQAQFGRTTHVHSKQAADFGSALVGAIPADAARYTAIMRFGECVAIADPTRARDFVLSRAASTGETAQIAQISPVLGGCVSAGSSIRLSKELVRGAVAAALYRDAVDKTK